jgi:CheY-like chemotaxis protein
MNEHRVLMIDDDPALTEVVSEGLRDLGLQVRTENQPSNACKVATDFKPDLVLLDVDMPGMAGGEVADALGKCPCTANTPIIFMTSLVSSGQAGAGKIGGNEFIAKPADALTIANRIRATLQG